LSFDKDQPLPILARGPEEFVSVETLRMDSLDVFGTEIPVEVKFVVASDEQCDDVLHGHVPP
jgi:hypothetical protein